MIPFSLCHRASPSLLPTTKTPSPQQDQIDSRSQVSLPSQQSYLQINYKKKRLLQLRKIVAGLDGTIFSGYWAGLRHRVSFKVLQQRRAVSARRKASRRSGASNPISLTKLPDKQQNKRCSTTLSLASEDQQQQLVCLQQVLSQNPSLAVG